MSGVCKMFSRQTCAILVSLFIAILPAFAQYKIVWGDVHGHTSNSDGKGSLDDYFTHARDVAKLDFVIVTDHDFGNSSPWRMPKEKWMLTQDKADQYTVKGRFVAIAGYEWTSQAKYWSGFTNGPAERLFPGPPKFYNHKNVYFTNRIGYLFSAKDVAYNNPDTLAEVVRKHGGLIQNNHPFALFNEAGDQWEYVPANSSVIVNTEMGLDVSRYEGKTYELNWEKSLREFLNRGGRTGFVSGTDTHEGRPAARTAVLATELTREAIFDALRHRRNYAINHARIGLDFRINGHFMGEEIELAGKPQIMVDVKGTAPIEEIVIIRDGKVLHALRPQKQNVSFAYVDETFAETSYYYVRVIQVDKDEHGNKSHAWSSPIWVKKR
ncbi:MAG: CehA/McbA family metallohydrolase [Kiritimatiellae bacterium]|nr:CehA/McbA family metallohydrolase [Kiritimatiellia bacterium]